MCEFKSIDGVAHVLDQILKNEPINQISEDQFEKLIPCLNRLKKCNLNIVKDALTNALSYSQLVSKYDKSKSAISAIIRLAKKKHVLNQIPSDWIHISVLLPTDQANHVLKMSNDLMAHELKNLSNKDSV